MISMYWPMALSSAHHEGGGSAGRAVLDEDARLRASRGPHADTRLRADTRGHDGGVREELAAGVVSKIGRSAFGGKPENVCSL